MIIQRPARSGPAAAASHARASTNAGGLGIVGRLKAAAASHARASTNDVAHRDYTSHPSRSLARPREYECHSLGVGGRASLPQPRTPARVRMPLARRRRSGIAAAASHARASTNATRSASAVGHRCRSLARPREYECPAGNHNSRVSASRSLARPREYESR